MTTDEKLLDLTKYVESIKNQMLALHVEGGNRNAQICGLNIAIKALVLSHPDRDQFEHLLSAEHESFLASAVPSEWTDIQIELASKTVAAMTRR